MIERRSAKRFAKALPIVFSDSNGECRGISMDFSASGFFILTTEPLSPGTSLKIRLEVSERERVYLSGVVARTIKTGDINVKDGMGIKLDSIPYKYHQFLERIEKSLPLLGTE